MKKAFHVIKREYRENIKRKSFIISTILVPVMMLFFTIVPFLATLAVPDDQLELAVVDHTGELADAFAASLTDTLEDGRPKYVLDRSWPNLGDTLRAKELLLAQVRENALDMVIEIPADVYETGKFIYYTRDVGSVRVLQTLESKMNSTVLKQRLARAGLDYDKVKNLTKPVSMQMQRVSKSGQVKEKSPISDWGVAFVFVMLLYITVLTWGISIQRSLIEEKGSRVIEVLLSSLEPIDLFIGKVVGLGAVGLTQVAIWGALLVGLSSYGYLAAADVLRYVSISPWLPFYFLVFFVLGFLLYSAVFTVIGSVCSTEQEAQQFQAIVTLPLVIPIVLLMLVSESPNSPVVVGLSLFPLFSPMLMLARISIELPDFWQVALSVAILLVTTYGAIYFSARIFRVGILMYGKRPSFGEILRWFRYA